MTPRPTILVVDDEASICSVLSRFLARCGYVVLTASDAASAVGLAAAHPEPIALLLTDVQMPGCDGVRLAAHLHSKHAGLHVLFMSASPREILLSEGHKLPEQAVLLPKPFELSQLRETIAAMLEG